jgi:hypothetical protein
MSTLSVSSDRDRVVLEFPRTQVLILKPDEARRIAEGMRVAADDCEQWVLSGGTCELVRGEERGVQIKSWDGRVNVVFTTYTELESIPYTAARQVASLLETRAIEAEHLVTLVFVSSNRK